MGKRRFKSYGKVCPECGARLEIYSDSSGGKGGVFKSEVAVCLACGYEDVEKVLKESRMPEQEW